MSNIKDLADPNIDRVLIYAGDGGCYWRQSGCGYTYAHTAGVFTRAEAYSLAGHCGPEKRIELHSVPDDHVPTIQAENAALREQLSIATGERDALREAAAGWQALAEELKRRIADWKRFAASMCLSPGNSYCKGWNDGVIASIDHLGRMVDCSTTHADALAAHTRAVRATALREAAEACEFDGRVEYPIIGQQRLLLMAAEAEEEAGDAGA